MATAPYSPRNWTDSEVVMVESDAPDNIEAIHEIDDWAVKNGFRRINEYWLREAARPDGVRVFRGVCYRVAFEPVSRSA